MELIIDILVKIIIIVFKSIYYIFFGVIGAVSFVFLLAIDISRWLLFEGSVILWTFLDKYIFIILGVTCWVAAAYVFIFYKPHPATRHIRSYKKGKISRREAIEKISSTLYDHKKEKIPSAISSKIIEKRVQALRKRIKAEEGLLEDSVEYLKAKSRMK